MNQAQNMNTSVSPIKTKISFTYLAMKRSGVPVDAWPEALKKGQKQSDPCQIVIILDLQICKKSFSTLQNSKIISCTKKC